MGLIFTLLRLLSFRVRASSIRCLGARSAPFMSSQRSSWLLVLSAIGRWRCSSQWPGLCTPMSGSAPTPSWVSFPVG